MPKEGQRNTRHRLAVLKKLASHPTEAMRYDATGRRLREISLGTDYRNLKVLAENGVACRLDIGGGRALFDGSPDRG